MYPFCVFMLCVESDQSNCSVLVVGSDINAATFLPEDNNALIKNDVKHDVLVVWRCTSFVRDTTSVFLVHVRTSNVAHGLEL
jgi:hypothetical protein